ncbi:MAG TPA: hypothetical protein VGF79_08090 [Bacteroidia bacterium]
MNVEFELLLEKLLHKYECVIIPDFGGFIVRDSPSNFNNSKTVIKPTSKHIFFNPHLVQNDGLLYNEIQLAKAFTYSEAVDYCQSVISVYKQMMHDNGSVRFGQMGTFFQGKENNFWFSPSTTLNLSLESYGLFPVDLKTKSYQGKPLELETISNHEEEEVKIFEMVPDNKPIEPVERPNKVSIKAWLVAASLTLLVHFVYLKVEKTDVTTNEASLLPTVELVHNSDTVSSTPINVISDSTVIDTTSEVVPEVLVPDQVNPSETQSSPENTNANVTTTEAVSPEVLPEETKVETPVQTFSKVAKYKLEDNALSHKADLEKSGKVCKIERNGEWFEIFVEQ